MTTSQPTSSEPEETLLAEINITPLTDIFLVLLIIFMVTSTALTHAGIGVRLPEAKGASALTKPKKVVVRVDKAGLIYLENQPVDPEALETMLKGQIAGDEETTVIMEGDEAALLGQAVKVLDAAKRAGAAHISIATRPPPERPK